MNRCLNDRTLFALYGGDENQSRRIHLSECDACTNRYNDLVRDLEAIGRTLRQGPPPDTIRDRHPRFTARWLPAGVTLAIALLLAWTGVRMWTRSGLSPVDGNRNGETRSILDDLPANPFLTTEALAVELATEGAGSFDLAATVLEAERPCEWYDLPILNRADDGSEALELSEGNSLASCVDIKQDNEKRLPKTKSSKNFPKQGMEVLR
jgi:hypothetical protein